jgi:hypothetical protein
MTEILTKKCFFCGGTLTPIYDGKWERERIGWWECSRVKCQFNDDAFGEGNMIRDSYYRKIEKLIDDNAKMKALLGQQEQEQK